jgi:transglutaminase-like putative cysteine protease
MKLHACPRAIVALLFVLCASPVFAQDSSRYSGETWSLVDSAAVMKAAAEITAAKYPDSDDVTVESRMVRVYRADGTAESQDETFTKVLTEKGKRGNRTITNGFMLPYTTVEVARLEVLRPDGTTVTVDIAANSKESIDDSQMQANIYDPNVRVLRVNIPQLDIGDVVHVVTRTTTTRPYMPGEFADINVFEGHGYIRHMSYEVHAPADRPLKHVFLRDEVPGTIKASQRAGAGNTLVYHWDINNVRRMFNEPRMPSGSEVLQRVVVSTTPDWPAVSRWYWELSKPHLDAVTPEMKKQVADLIAPVTTDQDKIKALFYYVSKNIRYMGLTPEKDRPGFEPHDVCLTFDKKYGVCRDKAALLVSMLQIAGFDAYPVLISMGNKRDPQSPDPYFNHAIVGVESPKGTYILMDPTNENTVDLLPSYESDQSYLVCRPEGDVLRISPVQPAEQNMMRVKTTGRLAADGALEARSELWFDGINDSAYREFFAKSKPDDIRRFFESRVKGVLPGAIVKSLTVTPKDMLDTTQNVHAVVEFSAANTTAFGSGKAVVNVPWVGRDFGMVNFVLDGTGLEKRQYPLRTDIACGLQEEIAIQLADNFTAPVSIPTCAPVNDASITYQRKFAMQNGELTASREFKLNQVQISPAEYLVLKKTLESMETDSRKSPILEAADTSEAKPAVIAMPAERPAVESDSRLVDLQDTFTVQDAHNAVFKRKEVREVLTYNGKKGESEVKLSYNPAHQDVRLLRAVVTAKTGEQKEISPGEINTMDAGWNAGAKRYTGEKMLVANLPGVDIGSRIELEYEVVSRGRPYLEGFIPFDAFNEVEKKSYTLTAPASVTVHRLPSGAAGSFKSETKTTDAGQTFSWSAGRVAPLPSEGDLPPNWVYRAGVQYFIGDQKTYLKDLRAILVDRAGQSAKAAQRARELVSGAINRRAAATAIRDFVAKSIRLAGPGFTSLPLKELTAADTTLTDGYGHAADRAILLHALLAAADFKPEFILGSAVPAITSLAKTATTFPLPAAFTHPLVRVQVDGEDWYLNDTDQYARLGSTSYDGYLALELSTQRYFTIAAPAACRSKTTTDYEVVVSDTGKTRITRTGRYYGQDFGSRKKFFAELPPEERRRHFQNMVSDVAQGARAIGDLVTKFDEYPGIQQFTVEVDHYSVVDGKYLYLELPFSPGLFRVDADQRSLPMFLRNKHERTIRTVVQLPPAYRNLVIAPKSAVFSGPEEAGRAEISTTTADGQFTITHHFKSTPAVLAANDYPALVAIESTLRNKSSRLLLLKQD